MPEQADIPVQQTQQQNTQPLPETEVLPDSPEFAGYQPPPVEKVLLHWSAPERPFKKRDREYYTTIGAIVFLLSIILFFAGQFLPIAVVISFAFVSYVLASVPPAIVEHQVTTYGIRSGGKLYHWGELGRFWYTKRFDQEILHIEYNHAILKKIILMLGEIKEEDMTNTLLTFIPKETPTPTFMDNAASWLQEKFPLDNIR